MKTIKNYIYIIVTLLVVSCSPSKKENENTSNETHDENFVEITIEQFQNANMVIGKASMQTFHESVVTNGHIDVPPANSAQVSAIMGGYIKTAILLIGDEVQKGQLLLTLENPEFIEIQQNYLETFESMSFLKSEYERQKTLFEEKITSQKNYLKAESNYKRAVANINGLSQKLKLMNINPTEVQQGKITSIIPVYAPISGYVSEVFTSVGKFMDASEVLLTIIDSSHKHLELIVFEKDVLSIKEGQLIEFKTPENSDRLYTADVHLIGKSINDENRTVRVHGHLTDELDPFLVGMYVEAEIITYTTEKLAVPIDALLEEDSKYYMLVYKRKENNIYKFEKILVHIGFKNEDWIEIIDVDQEFKEAQILLKGAFIQLE